MKLRLLLLFGVTIPLAAQSPNQNSPALTIYNQDFAAIRDHIPLNLKSGSNNVQFSDTVHYTW